MRYEQLPEAFLKQMEQLLGPEMEAYKESLEENRIFGLRINTGKLSSQRFEELSPFPVRPVPWIPNGYFYEESVRASRDPYYYAGLYYLQEPSAMTPANLLPVTPGDRVLDLCAAPGGKSTELGVRLEGQGILFSNDISNSRAKALLKNLELFGIRNLCVASEAPEKLASSFPEFFDKILVDAPCSGEGMFRKDDAMVKDWQLRGPSHYCVIQKDILQSAYRMLIPGGMLLYSTCTFDRREDEEIITWLLTEYRDLELVSLPDKPGFARGVDMPQCVRLFPHKIRGEGHFIALLRKQGHPVPKEVARRPSFSWKGCEELQNFLSMINWNWDFSRLEVKNDAVYYLPEVPVPLKGIRYLRTGLLLGQWRNGRFEPSQALAMALKKEDFACIADFSRQDERVIRYLKGETLDFEPPVKGWCLVLVDGFPLGFAKGDRGRLKNKYYPGWRWQ